LKKNIIQCTRARFFKHFIFVTSPHNSTVHASRASRSRFRTSRALRIDDEWRHDDDDTFRVDERVIVRREARARDDS